MLAVDAAAATLKQPLLFLLLHCMSITPPLAAWDCTQSPWWLQDYFLFCAGCLVLQLAHFSLFIAKAKESDDPEDAFQRVVDNFIASWPMTTPTVLILALAVRIVRLKQRGIDTLQPDKLQAAANIEIVCFDKTGTLTANSVSLAFG